MTAGPIFFIGAPRSGTTILFESFAQTPALGWLSNYSEMWPAWPSANLICRLLDNSVIHMRGYKKQYGNVGFGNRYRPQPVEAYKFWDMYTGRNFSRSYLHNVRADAEEASRVRKAVDKVLGYQFRTRFVTKLTGPGRLGYLSSIFPDAVFVNVVRDGRAVVHSLLKVSFWREKRGAEAPFWEGGLTEGDVSRWHESGNDPAVLCAVQWNRMLELTLEESASLEVGKSVTVKYEDYVASPAAVLSDIYKFTGCEPHAGPVVAAGDKATVSNQNIKYRNELSGKTIDRITEAMYPMLSVYGYLEKE